METASSFELPAASKSGECSFLLEARSSKLEAGFTLVEMIVAVALFSIVMLVSVEALLSLVNANRKAQALQSVMNNLNIALDGMVRGMRMGSTFHCGAGSQYNVAQDCPNNNTGDTIFAFEPYGNTTADPAFVYIFDPNGSVCGAHQICRSENGGASFVAITAPEVTIDDMRFYAVGTTRGDTEQPKVVVVVKGSAGPADSSARTTFHIQATAVQRLLDL